uniref:Uncharacterized protein n=1 Tax=Anguilla anguilla TaxID=7936 RepID=A0A0E9PZC5_ANGAN
MLLACDSANRQSRSISVTANMVICCYICHMDQIITII